MAKPARCNITGVIGASQTGKGLYCHARLAEPYDGFTFVWSPLEAPNGNDHYVEVLRVDRPISSIPALVDVIKGGARSVVYVPQLEADGTYGKQFDRFCRIVRSLESCRVLVEELSRVTSPSWAPMSWANLSTAGAHADLELIGTAQAPTMIDKAFLGNATEIRCYRVNEESHARTMQGKMGVPWETLMNLPDRHFWHRWKSPAPRNESGVQPIPGVSPELAPTPTTMRAPLKKKSRRKGVKPL